MKIYLYMLVNYEAIVCVDSECTVSNGKRSSARESLKDIKDLS